MCSKTTAAPVNSELTALHRRCLIWRRGNRECYLLPLLLLLIWKLFRILPSPPSCPFLDLGAEFHLFAVLPRCIRPISTRLRPPLAPAPLSEAPVDTLSPLVCNPSGGRRPVGGEGWQLWLSNLCLYVCRLH